jgi:hypothetical protein
MSEPMTEAERAVVDVLSGDSECSWHVGCDVEDCYGPRAAAIVAKLRPLIAAETLEQFADKVELGPWYLHVTATARADAAALRTTTSEKEN